MPLIRSHFPLVLASTSSIREQMLKKASVHFSVITPRCDEEKLKQEVSGLSIPERCITLARAKAMSVSEIHAGWVVIGADQMCELDGEILSKPGTKENAVLQLEKLRGKTHVQHSAGVLVQGNKVIFETVISAKLTMRPLTDTEMESYIALDHPVSSCGAYKYESYGKHLFSKVEGNDDVIQGLPLQQMLSALYEKNILTMET